MIDMLAHWEGWNTWWVGENELKLWTFMILYCRSPTSQQQILIMSQSILALAVHRRSHDMLILLFCFYFFGCSLKRLTDSDRKKEHSLPSIVKVSYCSIDHLLSRDKGMIKKPMLLLSYHTTKSMSMSICSLNVFALMHEYIYVCTVWWRKRERQQSLEIN